MNKQEQTRKRINENQRDSSMFENRDCFFRRLRLDSQYPHGDSKLSVALSSIVPNLAYCTHAAKIYIKTKHPYTENKNLNE